MTAPIRRAIRDETVKALRASSLIRYLSDPPTVESSRVLPVDDASLPRILVYLRGETSQERLTESPRTYAAVGELVVEHVAKFSHKTVAEDSLDEIALAMESVLSDLELQRWGIRDANDVPLIRDSNYRATEIALSSDESQRRCVSVVLRYELSYERPVGSNDLVDRFGLGVSTFQTGDGPPPVSNTNLPQS